MPKRIPPETYIGKKYNMITVIDIAGVRELGKGIHTYKCTLFKCQCDCGKIIVKTSVSLKNNISCGCHFYNEKRLSYGESSLNRAYRQYRRHAKDKNRNIELTKEEFRDISQKDCYYCGSSPSNISKDHRSYGEFIYNGIDRVDNNLGYTLDNCVPCCIICNKAKSGMSQYKFLNWIKKLTDFQLQKLISN